MDQPQYQNRNLYQIFITEILKPKACRDVRIENHLPIVRSFQEVVFRGRAEARAATSLRGEGAARALVELLVQRSDPSALLRKCITRGHFVPKNEQASGNKGLQRFQEQGAVGRILQATELRGLVGHLLIALDDAGRLKQGCGKDDADEQLADR